MRARTRQMAIGAVLTLAASGLTVLSSPTASAEPCGGIGGPGSSPLFGSSGSAGGGPEKNPRGPQGQLPSISGNATSVAWVTGPLSPNNTYDRFGISGTDLGISWDNGSGQTLMAFGDTFGNCSVTGAQWRSNVLLRSDDKNLADGITVTDGVPGDSTSGAVVEPAGFASEVVPSLGVAGVEDTVIPTAAISIGDVQYMNYMSVRSWGAPGRWVTNFSAIAMSRDNGQTWQTAPATIRVNAGITIPAFPQVEESNGKYQMNAYAKGQDGYIYQFGTPNGRFGAAFVARVKPEEILDLTKYEYSTQDQAKPWSTNVADSKSVVTEPVSELSVAWNGTLKRYVMLYGNEVDRTIVARTSEKPEGPWSAPKTLLNSWQTNGGIYAPYIHPLSSGNDLYFTASRWSDYNVLLLRTNVDVLK
ncbi:DUF4185 domain-containing protein [Rhodococcus sp. NPDC057297]|uniref:DUF4185 domain-containing protein n=1 Tax=Rhodococcus sp. NPDC057297 TaxID=3346090 RepID=UPI003637BAAB